MDNKPKQSRSGMPADHSGVSLEGLDEQERKRKNTPNRRADEEQIHDFDTPSRSGQQASKRDMGSEPHESDRLDESQGDRQQRDMSRKQRQSEE